MKVTKLYITLTGLIVGLLCVSLQAAAQKPNFTLVGKFKNWPLSRHVVVIYGEGQQAVTDTVPVSKGKLLYKAYLEQPTEFAIYYDSPTSSQKKDSRRFLAAQGKVTLKHPDSLKTAAITGPLATLEYEQLQAQSKPFINQMVNIRIQAQQLLNQNENQDYSALEKEFKVAQEGLRQCYIAFIKEHPRSIVSLQVIKQLDGVNYADAQVYALYQGLSPQVQESPEGKRIRGRFEIGMKTSPGAILEDFTSLDTARRPLSLGEVKAQGTVTLVDFWASWCKPCREENPNLRKLYEKFHGKGLNIIAISLDRSEEAWKNAIRLDSLPWYHVSGLKFWDEPIVKQFGIQSVPESFLLDSEGRIIGRGLRGDQLHQAVQQALRAPLDSLQVRSMLKQFRETKDKARKLSIYQQLRDEPVLLNQAYGGLTVAGMQKEIALDLARQGKVHAFRSWAGQMTASAMRDITIAAGYDTLSKNMKSEDFLHIIRVPLDSLLGEPNWSNEQINLYSKLLDLYLRDIPQERSKDIVAYMTPLFRAQGNYFPADNIKANNDQPDHFKASRSFRYAKALLHSQEKDQAIMVIARAAEAGIFSPKQFKEIEAALSLTGLQQSVERHLALAKANYATKVRRLLEKNKEPASAAALRQGKKNYVLLDFWGTWCLPCRASHPKLVKIYEEFKGQGLEIVSIAHESPGPIEEVKKKWQKGIADDQLTWPQILNNDGLEGFDAIKEFSIAMFPTKILLDKDFNQIAVFQGADSTDKLHQMLEKLLRMD